MKYCDFCHKEYSEEENFCTECGRPLVHGREDYMGKAPEVPVVVESKRKGSSVLKKVLIAIVCVVLALVGIFNYLDNATTYLNLSPNLGFAPKGGGQIDINVNYDGFFWIVDSCPDWVKIKENERSLTVEAEPNPSGQRRVGVVIVESGKLQARAVIAQNGKATYIRTSEHNIHSDRKGGTIDVKVDSDGYDWTAEFPSYLSVKKIDDVTLRISFPENDGYAREGYCVVREDHKRAVIQLSQGGTCQQCRGTGEMVCSYCNGFSYMHACPYCGGSGKEPCRYCQGRGYIE